MTMSVAAVVVAAAAAAVTVQGPEMQKCRNVAAGLRAEGFPKWCEKNQ